MMPALSLAPVPHLLKQSLLLTMARICGAFCGFCTMWLLARSLGAEALASVSVAISGSLILSALCTGYVEAGSVRFMTRYRQRATLAKLAGYVRFTRQLAVLMGAGISAVALGLIMIWAPESQLRALLWALAAAPLLGFVRVQAAHFMGSGRPLAAVVPRTLLRPLIFLLTSAACLALLPEAGPPQIMAGFALAALIVFGLQYLWQQPLRQELRDHIPDLTQRLIWAKVGVTLGVNLIFLEYGAALAVLSASFVLSHQDLARFDIALRLIGLLRFAQIASHQSLMPALAQALAQSDRPGCLALLRQSARVRLLACVSGALMVWLAGMPLLQSFGADFTVAYPVLLVLLIEPLLMTVFGPGAALLSVAGHPARLWPVLVVTLVLLVTLVVLAGHVWGLMGAALGFLAARAVWDFSLAWLARRETGLSPTLTVLRRAGAHG